MTGGRVAGPRAISLLLLAAVACGGGEPSGGGRAKPMTGELAADLAVVRQGRVYFYHHSVGVNVLAGIDALDRAAGGGRLRTAWLEEGPPPDGPILVHGGGGRNGEPKSKIEAFAGALRAEGLSPELAFMKFCYVDFTPSTDVEGLFTSYRTAIESLKRDRPEVRFAHVTVPLFRRPTDLKSRVRRLIGKEVWEDAANAKRAEFNRRLLAEFGGDPVFDLAAAEATGPDGSLETFEHGGRAVPSLHPGYTDDGGHLNEAGRRVAGEAALRFMAGALRGQPRG